MLYDPNWITKNHRSFSLARNSSLIVIGISTSLLVDYFVGDVGNTGTERLQVPDAKGREYIIFVEVETCIADYPVSWTVVDLLLHTDNSYCTQCPFRLFEGQIISLNQDTLTTRICIANIHHLLWCIQKTCALIGNRRKELKLTQ